MDPSIECATVIDMFRRGEYLYSMPVLGADQRPQGILCSMSVLKRGAERFFIEIANDTPFGLAAGIATSSLNHATHFKRHAQAGMVMVNLPTAGVDYHVPFGGRKASSYGPREQGRHAAEFYTTVKTAYTQA